MRRTDEDTRSEWTENQARSSALKIVESLRTGIMAEVLTEKDFRRLSELIVQECGIKMPNPKKIMLEARLRKRLRSLNIGSFHEYCDYLFTPEGIRDELVLMIDVVTTNKTDFFREPRHFEFLTHTLLPELIARGGTERTTLKIWSAGCSTGEEPYTLAMVLSEFAELHPGFGFEIHATDISTKVLERAVRGVYPENKIEPIPSAFRRKYLMKSRDKEKQLVRITPEIRSRVHFRRLNFMERDFGFRQPLDIIFCRNVIIYFNKPTQESLLMRFSDHLKPAGFLFMGHSETLSGMKLPFSPVGPTIYRKR